MALHELRAVRLGGRRDDVRVPVPVAAVFGGLVLLGVELLRIEAHFAPPRARAVFLRQHAVEVAGRLVPVPCVRRVDAHAPVKPGAADRLAPLADDVALRADPDGVPFLVFAVPQVEVVVVVRHGDDVLRAHAFEELCELRRIPFVALPLVDHVLEPERLLVAVFLLVSVEMPVVRDVHVPGVPVAGFRLALRPPVRENAELRVLVPLRHLKIRLHGLDRGREQRFDGFGILFLRAGRQEGCGGEQDGGAGQSFFQGEMLHRGVLFRIGLRFVVHAFVLF